MPFNQTAEDIKNEAVRCIERLRNFRLPYDPQRDEMYRQFVGKGRQMYYPDKKTKRSNVFVPYAFANVEQIRSEVHDIFWGVDPPFTVLPGGQKDEDAAIRMQPVMEVMALKKGKLRQISDEFVGGLCIYGFQALDVGWNYDYYTTMDLQTVPVTDDNGGIIPHPAMPDQPLLQRKMVPVKIPYNQPKYECIDIYDLLVDPDGAFVAKLFAKTLPQFLREAEMYPNLYNGDTLLRLKSELGDTQDGLTSVIPCATLWDAVNGTFITLVIQEDVNAASFKDNRYSNRAATYTSNRRTLASIGEPLVLSKGKEQNPFSHCRVPLLYTSYIKLPGEIFGLGVIEPTYTLNEGLNRFVNMITDKWDLSINGRLLIDVTRDVDFNAMQKNNSPGGLLPVYGDPNNIVKEFPMPKPEPGDFGLIPIYQNLIELSSGKSNFYDRGIGSSMGNDTATGISAVITQSSRRTGRLILRLEDEIFEPLLQMTASNIQQFLTDDIEVLITDELRPFIPKVNSQFLTISPKELQGSYNFKFVGAAYRENPFVTQRNILALTNVIATNPGLAAYVKPHSSLREIFRVFRIPNPNQFLKTEEEVAAEQAAQQQAALQQMLVLQQLGLDRSQQKGPGQGKGGGGSKPSVLFEGEMPAPITGQTRDIAQNGGANVMGGMSEPNMVKNM